MLLVGGCFGVWFLSRCVDIEVSQILFGASAFEFASRTGRLGAELESLGDGGARWNRLFCREQVELE